MQVKSDRVFGLDVMRSLAILLVLFVHSTIFFPRHFALMAAYYPYGYWGVELFFVLSGFLIGEMLFRLFEPKRKRCALGKFWIRRFLRTFPNYYLFILINIAIAYWFGEGLPPIWKYLVFAQNLTHPPARFFMESWTLAIEVWFYLLIPVLFYVAFKIAPAKFRVSSLLIVLTAIGVVTVIRSRAVTHLGVLAFWGARMVVLYRVDACLYGLIAAWVKHFYPTLFSRARYLVFIAGIVLSIFAIYYNLHPGYSVFGRRAAFVATSLGAMMFLPMMDNWRTVPRGGGFVGRLSLWAYSLYLANIPVRKLLQHFVDASPYVMVFLYLFICFVVAEFIYAFYEKPMMDLRDRWPFRSPPASEPQAALERQASGI
jgi:peptidoglycan/LPS O-acetylase OafA/YrhL